MEHVYRDYYIEKCTQVLFFHQKRVFTSRFEENDRK